MNKMGKKLILIYAIALILFSCIVSAQSVWDTYANNIAIAPQVEEEGIGQFDLGVNNISTTNGYYIYPTLTTSFAQRITPVQPLVSYLDKGGFNYQPYLIFPNNNYLQIYNKNLILLNELYMGGQGISQIDLVDFDNDGIRNDIAGLYAFNSSLISFRVISLDASNDNLELIYEENFTTSNHTIGGVRHRNNNVYFVYSDSTAYPYPIHFVTINETASSDVLIGNSTSIPYEPLGYADVDNDGEIEFLTMGDRDVLLFDENGNLEFYSSISTANNFFLDARIFQPDATSIYKIALLRVDSTSSVVNLTAYKPDGTQYWYKTFNGNGGNPKGRLAVIDYSSNSYDDLAVITLDSKYTTRYINSFRFRVYEGADGDILATQDFNDRTNWGATTLYGTTSLTMADLNNNGYEDFIFSQYDGIFIYDVSSDSVLLEKNTSTYSAGLPYFTSCIPADLNADGYLEVICSGKEITYMFYTGITNNNAEIQSVTYDTSTSIQVNETLYMYITATDNEGDTIFYSKRCSNDDSWSSDSYSSTLSCIYPTTGIFNNSVRVRDIYHSDYDYYSTNILVSVTGDVCDNDGFCESGQGETYINCPNDCQAPSENYTQADGGLAIPTKLVDTENTEHGLLPEIYYGTLAFFSRILPSFIIVVFIFIFALTILMIGFIFKKIAKKVGGN